jgi:hypothetical protein
MTAASAARVDRNSYLDSTSPLLAFPSTSATDMVVSGNLLACITSDGGLIIWDIPAELDENSPGVFPALYIALITVAKVYMIFFFLDFARGASVVLVYINRYHAILSVVYVVIRQIPISFK